MSEDNYDTYIVTISKQYKTLKVNASSSTEAVRIAKQLPWEEPVDVIEANLEPSKEDKETTEALESLENELLNNTNRFCINGNCED
tara:strand:- start:880 stop:1137 length:258 start_codon:yes stop_codon:yes gene_type:complete